MTDQLKVDGGTADAGEVLSECRVSSHGGASSSNPVSFGSLSHSGAAFTRKSLDLSCNRSTPHVKFSRPASYKQSTVLREHTASYPQGALGTCITDVDPSDFLTPRSKRATKLSVSFAPGVCGHWGLPRFQL